MGGCWSRRADPGGKGLVLAGLVEGPAKELVATLLDRGRSPRRPQGAPLSPSRKGLAGSVSRLASKSKPQVAHFAIRLVCSQERVKDLETQIKDLKQLEQENEVLRATIQQLTVQPMPSVYP